MAQAAVKASGGVAMLIKTYSFRIQRAKRSRFVCTIGRNWTQIARLQGLIGPTGAIHSRPEAEAEHRNHYKH